MATIAFGFFAVLIARELPGRQRVMALPARLRWWWRCSALRPACTWACTGSATIAGGALARHRLAAAARPRLPPPRRALVLDATRWRGFNGAFAVAALWHAPPYATRWRSAGIPIARGASRRCGCVVVGRGRDSWPRPRRPAADARDRRAGRRPLQPLAQRLRASGWRAQTPGELDRRARPARRRPRPSRNRRCCRARWMRAPNRCCCGARDPARHAFRMLRLWRAASALDDAPLWLGAQSLAWTHPLHAFGLWRPVPDGGGAHATAAHCALRRVPGNRIGHDGRMLRVRTDAPCRLSRRAFRRSNAAQRDRRSEQVLCATTGQARAHGEHLHQGTGTPTAAARPGASPEKSLRRARCRKRAAGAGARARAFPAPNSASDDQRDVIRNARRNRSPRSASRHRTRPGRNSRWR